MTTQKNNQHDHEEIMSLLPWFVNKTLDERRSEIVSEHLKHCDECQQEVKFLGSMNKAVQEGAQDSYQSHADVDRDLQKVMARIDANEEQASARSSGNSFVQQQLTKLGDFFSVMPFGMQGATALAGGLVAVLGLQLYYGQTSEDYSVLSSPEINETSIRLFVEVSSAIDADEATASIRSLFGKHGQDVVFEKGANGDYVIVVNDTMDIDDLNNIVLDLNDQTSVERVEILP